MRIFDYNGKLYPPTTLLVFEARHSVYYPCIDILSGDVFHFFPGELKRMKELNGYTLIKMGIEVWEYDHGHI
jgi:hypothetical protein